MLTKTNITRDDILFWISKFEKGDYKDPEYQQSLIDTFVNRIYLYDDRIKIVFNYSGDGNKLDVMIKTKTQYFV